MTSVRNEPGRPSAPLLHVVRPGALTTVQDAGRPGWAHLGVGRAGVLDAPPPGWPTGWRATGRAPPSWRPPSPGARSAPTGPWWPSSAVRGAG
ncbi:hypothetical protein ACN24K_11080 [Streptomyces microflavus]